MGSVKNYLYKKVRFDGREGVIIEVRGEFAKIFSQGEILWKPLSEVKESNVVEKLIRGELDDPTDFTLAIDAYRLDTEYKFNPYVLASSTKIEIYPHQIDEVMLMLDRPRMLLADEVGLGKTITAALVASELAARGIVKRMLFVVPKAIVDKWVDELRNRFEMDAEILDSTYLKINRDPFKRGEFCFVASMDTLKQDYFLKLLENTDFDLVVVDEAHKLSKGTERFKLGNVLAKNSRYMYFLTATPHRGDEEDYMARLKLLDPYITDVDSGRHLIIRNFKSDVITIDGKEVFPPRESKTVEIPISREEAEVHRALDGFIVRKLEGAKMKGDVREVNSVRFLGIVLRKRASSSFYALKVSLENRLKREAESRMDVEKIIRELREAEEEFDEETKDEKERELLSQLIVPKDFEKIRKIIEKIEACKRDSKLETLLTWIDRIKSSDLGAKIVIFTEYRDTLSYLSKNLAERYRVATIDGSMPIEARKRALEHFRDPEGAEIMVCTDAAGEGIDMQFSNIEINYDIPWSPVRLEQRMGRLHRIGQERKVFYYNFVVKDTLDGYILAKLLDKMESIRKALGERVYDVIGALIPESELNKLFEELLRVPREEWERKVKKLDEIVDRRRKVIEEISRLLTGHRLDRAKLDDLKETGKKAIDENEVMRFVEVFVNNKGGKLRKVDGGIYEVVLPREIAYEVGRGIIRGTFSRELALKTTYPYLALGNKVVMAMLRNAMREGVAVFKHPYLKGFIFFFKISVIDGKGQERFGRFIGIAEDEYAVDPKIVWDLEPYEDKIPEPATVMEVSKKLERKALELAISYMNDVKKRFEEVKSKAKDIITSFYSEEINKLDRRVKEYEKRIAEAPHHSRLIKSAQSRINNLRRELEEKLRELDEIYRFMPLYELVGVAYVIPFGDSDERREVDDAGMRVVMEYERKRARTGEERSMIKDVSKEFLGYDIQSFDRVIEVKSFKETGKIEMTSNEWIMASRLGDYYWLYVVEDALTEPKITRIKNPAKVFKKHVVKVPKIEWRYVVEDWKKIVKGS